MAARVIDPFKKVNRSKIRLRMTLCGPAGSGKSYTALRIASALAHFIKRDTGKDARIAAIDTEHGSLAKYAGTVEDGLEPWDWSNIDLDDFSPTTYTSLVKAAEDAGYDILVIDSLTHAWTGAGGALEQVDRLKAASRSGNAFTDGWRNVTPMHNAMVEQILSSKCHVIATMRAKMEYVMEQNERGQTVPKKIGMGPIQRQGMEYEFDVVADIEQSTHAVTVSKSRCSAIDGMVVTKPGAMLASTIWNWLNSGVEVKREVFDSTMAQSLAASVGVKTEADVAREIEEKSAKAAAAESERRRKLQEMSAASVSASANVANDSAVAASVEKTAGVAVAESDVAATASQTTSLPAGQQETKQVESSSVQPSESTSALPAKCTTSQLQELDSLRSKLRIPDAQWRDGIAKRTGGSQDPRDLTTEKANEVIAVLRENVEKQQKKAAAQAV